MNPQVIPATLKRMELVAKRNSKYLELIAEVGGESFYGIAKRLNAAGHTTARGCLFTADTVKRIQDAAQAVV